MKGFSIASIVISGIGLFGGMSMLSDGDGTGIWAVAIYVYYLTYSIMILSTLNKGTLKGGN